MSPSTVGSTSTMGSQSPMDSSSNSESSPATTSTSTMESTSTTNSASQFTPTSVTGPATPITVSTTAFRSTSVTGSLTGNESVENIGSASTTRSPVTTVQSSTSAGSAAPASGSSSSVSTFTTDSSTEIFTGHSRSSDSPTHVTLSTTISSIGSESSPTWLSNVSSSVSDHLNVTDTESPTVTAPRYDVRDVHVYLFTGVPGGLLLLVSVFLILLISIKQRRRRCRNADGEMPEVRLVAQSRHVGKDDYWEIDLQDRNIDTRIPPDLDGCNGHRGNGSGRSAEQTKPGSTASGAGAVPLKTFRLRDNSVGGQDSTEQNPPEQVYFILEPRNSEGHQSDIIRSGADHEMGETLRDSDPYYSEIGNTDGSLGGAKGTTTLQRTVPQGISDTPPALPNSGNDYEDVALKNSIEPGSDLSSEPKQGKPAGAPEKEWVSKPCSLTPPSPASLDEEDLVMVVNTVYQSADELIPNAAQPSDNGHGCSDDHHDVDDELIMIDNVIYQSVDDTLPEVTQAATDRVGRAGD